jgi:hypothetical protein
MTDNQMPQAEPPKHPNGKAADKMASALDSAYIGGAGDATADAAVKEVVQQRIQAQKKAERTKGALNMCLGLLLLLVGGGISWASLTHFFETGGGWIFVFYGMIITGAALFVIGLSQFIRWHISRPRKHYVSSAVIERSGLPDKPAFAARNVPEAPILKAISVDEEAAGAVPGVGAAVATQAPVKERVPGSPLEYAMSWRGSFYFKYVTPILLMGSLVAVAAILINQSPMDLILLAVVIASAVLFPALSAFFFNLRYPVTLVGGILRIGRDSEARTVLLSEIAWIREFYLDRAFFVVVKFRGPTPAGRWLAFVLPFRRKHELRDGKHPLVLLLRQRTAEFGGRCS